MHVSLCFGLTNPNAVSPIDDFSLIYGVCVMAPNKIFCASGPSKPPLSICVVCGDYLCPPPLSVKGFAHKRSGSFAAGATSPLTSSYDERSMKLAFSSAGIFRRLFRHVAWKSSNAVTVNRPIDRSLCL